MSLEKLKKAQETLRANLRLLPFDREKPEMAVSFTVLNLIVETEVYRQINALPQTPVPQYFGSFCGGEYPDGIRYDNTQQTAYGTPLMAVKAGDLAGIQTALDAPTMAYLRTLPPDTRIALWWY